MLRVIPPIKPRGAHPDTAAQTPVSQVGLLGSMVLFASLLLGRAAGRRLCACGVGENAFNKLLSRTSRLLLLQL